MTVEQIQAALSDITAEKDITVKHLKLASLCSTLYGERGVDLVVVGGSAIEFYTEGAYTSGDLDLCVLNSRQPFTIRLRQEIAGQLGAKGGPRSWEIAGAYVDVLGSFESLARTSVRAIDAPYGKVNISPVEELIVERVLVSHYPQEYPPALDCAKKILAAGLLNEVEVDWDEVRRLAQENAYRNWTDVRNLTHEQAEALQVRSPYDSDEGTD